MKKLNVWKYLALSFLVTGSFLGFQQRVVGQQNCWLNFPYGGGSATITITTPWGDTGDYTAADNPSYFTDQVTVGNAEVPAGTYPGWCLDFIDNIDGGPEVYNTLLYSSCDTNLDAELHDLGLGYPGTVYIAPQVWNEINYILNNNNGAYFYDIQFAIWNLIGGPPQAYAAEPPYPSVDTNEVNALLSAAATNATNWQLQCGDVIGVIVAEIGGDFNPVQLTMLVVPYPCVPCVSVSKQIACLEPTNSCSDFTNIASGYAGSSCTGLGFNEPGFCYQISVTNCGTIPLTNLVISDNLLGLLTPNFFGSPTNVLQPGAGATTVVSMSFASNATNTVTVTGDLALTNQTVTNLDNSVVTNGEVVAAFGSAIALVDQAAITCSVALYSPQNLDTNSNGSDVVLPGGSSSNTVTLNINVTNTGAASLNGVTISIPALSNFNCTLPAPFYLAAGGYQNVQLCLGSVTCPVQMIFNVTVTGTVASDANHCGIYDLSSTNLISVCSSCMGSISCSTNCNPPVITGVPVGTSLGCNPSNVPTVASVQAQVSVSSTSPATVNVTGGIPSTNGCLVTQIFTIIATNACGLTATAYVTNTWTANTTPPVISGVPAGTNYGLNPPYCDALPAQQGCLLNFPYGGGSATITITTPWGDTGDYTAADNPSYFIDQVTVGNAEVPAGTYPGWCLDFIDNIDGGPEVYNTLLYSSCDTNLDAELHDLGLGYPGTVYIAPQVWNEINYILNNNNGAYFYDIQFAIWNLIGGPPQAYAAEPPYPSVDTNEVNALLSAAATNATNWQLQCGDVIGVIVAEIGGDFNPVQLTMLVVPYPCVPCISTNIGGLSASSPCGPATITQSSVITTNCCLVTQIFTIVATDECGNTATANVTNTWTVTVAPPVISGVPAGTNYGCNPASVPTSISGLSASDSCGTAAIAQSNVITTNGCQVTQVFTIVATGGCGATSTAYVTNAWTANTTPPTINGVPAGTNYGCNPASVPSSIAGLSASDACGTAAITQTNVTTTNGCLVTQIFTIVATDGCGNTSTAYVTNTWTANTTPPVISGVPAGTNYGLNPPYCDALPAQQGCLLNFPYGGGSATITITTPWGDTGDYTAADNPSYFIDQVTVGNAEVPAGTYPGWCLDFIDNIDGGPEVYNTLLYSSCDTNLDAELHDLGLGYPGTVYIAPQVWNEINYILNNNNGAYFYDIQFAIWNLIGGPPQAYAAEPPYPSVDTNEVNALLSAAATNATNWQLQCGDVIGVIVAEIGGDFNPVQLTMLVVPYPCVPCISTNIGGLSASSPCGPATITQSSVITTNCCLVTQIFTIVATDECGNTATANVTNTWTVTVAPPVISGVPAGTNYGCNPASVPTSISGLSASDSCGTAAIAQSNVITTNGCQVTQVFTIVATGGCGATSTAYVTNAWTANTTPPTINGVPAGTNYGCNPASVPSSIAGLSASDACGTAAITQTNVTTTNGCLVTQIFTIVATDGCGNTSTAYVTNTWTANTTPPMINGVPAGTNYGCNPASVPSSIAGLSASDACGSAGVSQSSTTTTNGCLVTQIFTIVATDGCGNTSTAYVTNTWTANTTPPAINGVPAGTNYGCNPASVPTSIAGLSASDACGSAGVSQSSTTTTNGCLVTQIFTIVATDGCGNTSTAYVTNTWTANTTPPAINGVPAGTNYGCNPASVPSSIAGLSASDACGSAAIAQSSVITTNGCLVTQIFTIVATDGCGNTSTAYVTNTWTANTTPPTINGVPAGTNYGCNPASVPSSIAGLSASDACGSAGVSQSSTTTTNGCLVTQIFTIVATDGCGNTSTAYVTNTWTANTTPPTINGVPAGTNYGCNPASVPTSIAGLSASDACGSAAIAQSSVITTNGCLVTQIFTIVATDGCGNTSTAYVTNTWTANTTPPTINGVPAGTNYGCNPASVPSSIAGLSASDACGSAGVSQSSTTTTNGCLVTQIFTIVATDGCGNTSTAYVTNTWTANTTPPTINGVPAGTNYGCNPASVPTSIAGLSASDACGSAAIAQNSVITTNGCQVTQTFTIVATGGCGLTSTAYVTNTWTANSTPPVISGLPAGTNYGCNPTNLPLSLSGLSASNACGTAAITQTNVITTNGCEATQIFTIVAADNCGNTATVYVTNTWTANSTPPLLGGVPVGTNLGCNPSSVPTVASVQAVVYSTNNTCSPATVHVTGGVPSTNGCQVTQIFTIIATNTCGSSATAYVTNTWTANTTAPVLSGVPAGAYLGCNPTNVPTTASVQAQVYSTNDTCSPATVIVTGGNPVTNGCGVTQVFAIVATNACGNTATAYVTNSWTELPALLVTNITFMTNTVIVTNTSYLTNTTITTNCVMVTNITVTTNCCTNAICGGFNGRNPGGWVWLNAHLNNANPGQNCTVYCQNAWITLTCSNQSYSYRLQNGQVNFSTTCTVATNWYNAINQTWNTTVPAAGDSEIFVQGIAIQWQPAFANCQSVCWEATFSSATPGLNCNWQWGAACYTNSMPGLGSIAPKACLQTACPNGQYYNANDNAGSPENDRPYCVAGGTGFGGGNFTGNWNGDSTTCTFGLTTNITYTPVITYTTNTTVTTNTTTTPVTTVTTNTTVTPTILLPVLSGVPSGMNFGCNPTNVPTVASVEAEVSASETCSSAAVQVTVVTTTNGCAVTQIFTISAANACGGVATAQVTNTWTADTIPPVISGVPTNTFLGCGITNLPTDSTVLAGITAVGECGPATLTVSYQDTTNGCEGMRTFTITAMDTCGLTTTTNVTYSWIGYNPELCTNSICRGFNSRNPGSGWLWFNANVSGNPGQNCTLYCQNASVTLNCWNGQSYTYPVPNGTIHFSSTCTQATNWFDGTNWNTILPSFGDNQIFLAGCGIPWQPAFAGCQNVCWTGVFSCDTPGLAFNWQWGAACYANNQPSYASMAPKACLQNPCPNGQYYNTSDYAGTPENNKSYCVGGGTGLGGANYTGSWSGVDTTCTFSAGYLRPPVLNGVPANDNLGINPTNIPTVASVEAEVTATDTCSPAPVYVTMSVRTNTCNVTQIFTISATNLCGQYAIDWVTNTWMTLSLTNHSTNTICTSFNSQEPASGWLWFNCQLSGKPGNQTVLILCTNATVTLACTDGNRLTYPVPNASILFSPSCTVATNWFDGTNWNTILPSGGDDQIFLSGCTVPWRGDFGRGTVCWSGDFSCNVPGLSFNWQFGAACYTGTQPAYGNLAPKACHQTPCPNGQYFNQNDNAGAPENYNSNSHCVGGGTGLGGSNWTGNFSNPGTCNF